MVEYFPILLTKSVEATSKGIHFEIKPRMLPTAIMVILPISCAQGNFFDSSPSHPLLEGLWIESKYLTHPGTSESAIIECQVECHQQEGCEVAQVHGDMCRLGTLTKWEFLPSVTLVLAPSNAGVFVARGE